MYGLWDKNPSVGVAITTQTEADLLDVTENKLQLSTTSIADVEAILTALEETVSGWYIRLETTGEKALAPPRLYSGAAYFATYAPFTDQDVNSCGAGNVGMASVYALNYLTGEAIVNYFADNDFTSTDDAGYEALFNLNSRATPYGLTPEGGTAGLGVVLQKIDRKVNLPTGGIPSPPVIVNDVAFIGAGGALPKVEIKKAPSVFQLYWRTK
jgi:type IV pilus assembly protein PilY1